MSLTIMRAATRNRSRRTPVYYVLLAPALVLSVAVVVVPGLMTVYLAFTDWTGLSFNVNWVGIDNFREIFRDPIFATSLGNNVRWVAIFLTVPPVIGMLTAWLLLARNRTKTLYQTIFLMPYVLAPAVNALIWLNIVYNPTSGVLGYVRSLGHDIQSPLAMTQYAIYAVALVDLWHYWGFLTVVYFGALRQTPVELLEAARIDGANSWGIWRRVQLPVMLPTIKLLMVMTVIFSFLAFDYVYLISQGGPAHASEVMGTFAYSLGFSAFMFGKAAAVGVVMSLFGLAASVVYSRLSRVDAQ